MDGIHIDSGSTYNAINITVLLIWRITVVQTGYEQIYHRSLMIDCRYNVDNRSDTQKLVFWFL